MAVIINRTCDTCGADLTHDNGADLKYINVRLMDMPHNPNSNIRYDVYYYPPIDKGGDFCSRDCLKAWADKL